MVFFVGVNVLRGCCVFAWKHKSLCVGVGVVRVGVTKRGEERRLKFSSENILV